MSAARFLDDVRARAALACRRIVFPESGDSRTLDAVRTLSSDGIARPLLVRDRTTPRDVPGIEIIDPPSDPRREAVADRLAASPLATRLGATQLRALALSPLYFADGLVALGAADGCVAGAVCTTADVVRAALRMIGPAPHIATVSSAFYMVLPDDRVLTFADCAVVPVPTATQLAGIAEAAADDRRRIVGDAPRVAFLSYSTRGSAGGKSVDRVQQAVATLGSRRPDLKIDGELQADAALVPEVAARKVPGGGSLAGGANVLVFPSLDAGNIAYKLVERLARAVAVGPILQGLARPCSDLSRGARPHDIINVAAITSLQGDTG
jgi:phosphate acetyltransferase